jgi:type IV secretion system protein VirB10
MLNHKSTLLTTLMLLWLAPAARTEVIREPEQQSVTESQMTVPEGTVIPIVLTAYINTCSSQVGDMVYADTVYPIWLQQRLVIPKGSMIRGTITEVVRPGKIKGKGRLAIRFDDILLPNGIKRELNASLRSIHGPGDVNVDRTSESVSAGGSGGTDAGTIMGTTNEGAIIGAIAGHGSGAAIGAGAGAAAGAIITLFTRGQDLVLSPGTQFDLELRKSIVFDYSDLEFTNAEINNAQRIPAPGPSRPYSQYPDWRGRRPWPF